MSKKVEGKKELKTNEKQLTFKLVAIKDTQENRDKYTLYKKITHNVELHLMGYFLIKTDRHSIKITSSSILIDNKRIHKNMIPVDKISTGTMEFLWIKVYQKIKEDLEKGLV